ncbi:MAG: AAA family ATPase [Tyzzerella sp.]|nr:AAA family ATPase [Tyzzerella sp.]
MRLIEFQFYNRAPFENLKISLGDANISIFSGINGAGKTTILSYVTDAFYELAKKAFSNEFEGVSSKFYRVSSNLTMMDPSKNSFVYLRFENAGKIIDYIDMRLLNDEEEYNNSLQIKNAIPYAEIKNRMKTRNVLKYFNISETVEITKFFEQNILTYFPAYRYEQPGYLNDPYTISLNFKKDSEFTGYLINPIEVTSGIPEIANWIMDIILDSSLYEDETRNMIVQLNRIFTTLLATKVNTPVRLGIGPRQNGATRIQIVKQSDGEWIYPSIFNMSSGELALIGLFCEIIRQADRLSTTFDKVKGIVLVDEIDKHLHIKMQKDVLPKLIKLFPNVQFILTSHSPFLNLGFSSEKEVSYSIYDMDNGGLSCKPQSNDLFEEVYQILVSENEQFAKKYHKLVSDMEASTKPLVITEGKTDWKHLKVAMKALGINDLAVEFYEYEDTMGDETLIKMLNQFSIISPNRKIIGMFDRDNADISKSTSKDGSSYVQISKNIYAFSIPMVNEEIYGTYTSIEHYYKKEQLLMADKNGRRLFLGEEFYDSGISRCQKYQTRFKGIQNKVKVNGIIDEKVYSLKDDPEFKQSIALSKEDFVQMVLDDASNERKFDFTEFLKIFAVIREIIAL